MNENYLLLFLGFGLSLTAGLSYYISYTLSRILPSYQKRISELEFRIEELETTPHGGIPKRNRGLNS